jgi:diacylglycerol kinase family enzyme
MRTHSVLVINPRSGQGSRHATELVAAARKLGIEPHVLAEGEDPGEAAWASGAEILGMAGGDGSLAPVAQVALDADAALLESVPQALCVLVPAR